MALTPHEREVRAAERRAYIEKDIREAAKAAAAQAPPLAQWQIDKVRALLGPTLQETLREIQDGGLDGDSRATRPHR